MAWIQGTPVNVDRSFLFEDCGCSELKSERSGYGLWAVLHVLGRIRSVRRRLGRPEAPERLSGQQRIRDRFGRKLHFRYAVIIC